MTKPKIVPVEAGQWRRGAFGTVWCVLWPEKTRPGRWICTSDAFPYDIANMGRREIEAMPLVRRNHFGPWKPHPGSRYWKTLKKLYLADQAKRQH